MAERPGGWGRSVAPSHEFRLLLDRFMIGGHRENPFTEQFVRLVMHQIAGEARHLGAGFLRLQPEHQDRLVGLPGNDGRFAGFAAFQRIVAEIEPQFGLATVGPAIVGSMGVGDVYVTATFMLVLATTLIIGNIIADLLLVALDPRIRLGGSAE